MKPNSWVLQELGEVSTVIMGQSPPSTFVNEAETGLPFIQGNAEFGHKYPSPNKWCSYKAKQASPGDILLSVRAPVGALNIADRELVIGRGLCAIRFNNGVDPFFGWYGLCLAVRQRLSSFGYLHALGYVGLCIHESRNNREIH